MREQALQEQERRQTQERAQKEQEQQRPPPAAMRVPLHSIAVDVPPQVLQVFNKVFFFLKNSFCINIVAGPNKTRKSNKISCNAEAEKSSETVFKWKWIIVTFT